MSLNGGCIKFVDEIFLTDTSRAALNRTVQSLGSQCRMSGASDTQVSYPVITLTLEALLHWKHNHVGIAVIMCDQSYYQMFFHCSISVKVIKNFKPPPDTFCANMVPP